MREILWFAFDQQQFLFAHSRSVISEQYKKETTSGTDFTYRPEQITNKIMIQNQNTWRFDVSKTNQQYICYI